MILAPGTGLIFHEVYRNNAVGIHTNLIAALALSGVASAVLLEGAWLWQELPWGSAVLGTVYRLALSAATFATVVISLSEDWTQLLLWGPIGVGCLIAGILLLVPLEP